MYSIFLALVVKSGQNFNPIKFYWSCISPLAFSINQAKEEYPDLICHTSTQQSHNGQRKRKRALAPKRNGQTPYFGLNYNKRKHYSLIRNSRFHLLERVANEKDGWSLSYLSIVYLDGWIYTSLFKYQSYDVS